MNSFSVRFLINIFACLAILNRSSTLFVFYCYSLILLFLLLQCFFKLLFMNLNIYNLNLLFSHIKQLHKSIGQFVYLTWSFTKYYKYSYNFMQAKNKLPFKFHPPSTLANDCIVIYYQNLRLSYQNSNTFNLSILSSLLMQNQQYYFRFISAEVGFKNVAFYQIQVEVPGSDQHLFEFKARYSQLRAIHDLYTKSIFKERIPKFPQKTFLQCIEPQFIEKRRVELEKYYNSLMENIDIRLLPDLQQYLQRKREKFELLRWNEAQNAERKQQLLQNSLNAIYQDIVQNFIIMTDEFYPNQKGDMSQLYANEIAEIQPIQSELLRTPTVKGISENKEAYWASLCLRDDKKLLDKAESVFKQINAISRKQNSSKYSLSVPQ